MTRIIDETTEGPERTERAEASLTVETSYVCDLEQYSGFFALDIELDEEYNQGKTCFGLGERAYFRVYSSGRYRMGATMGNSYLESPNVGVIIEDEYVHLTDFNGNASKPIFQIIRLEWVGKSLGQVKYFLGSGKLIVPRSRDRDGFGVLKISYATRFNRYYHIVNEEGDVLVYAIQAGDYWPGNINPGILDPLGNDVSGQEEPEEDGGGRIVDETTEDEPKDTAELEKVSLAITFRRECVVGDNDVTIVVKNFITGETIPGASVRIDGTAEGVTDQNGQWYAGRFAAGNHTIVVTADGYQPSGADMLANDEFVVTSPTEG